MVSGRGDTSGLARVPANIQFSIIRRPTLRTPCGEERLARCSKGGTEVPRGLKSALRSILGGGLHGLWGFDRFGEGFLQELFALGGVEAAHIGGVTLF